MFDEKTKRNYCFLGKSETIIAVIFVISNITSPVRVRKLTARGVHICKYRGSPLTWFPLPGFLAYVCVNGGISVSRGPQYSPTNTNFM